jgi:hypothetical protein
MGSLERGCCTREWAIANLQSNDILAARLKLLGHGKNIEGGLGGETRGKL